MSPSRIEPASGCCSVAMVRISVDLPAPFGPRRPNIPAGMSSETLLSARTPLPYVFDRFAMDRFIVSRREGEEARVQRYCSLEGRSNDNILAVKKTILLYGL